MRCLSFVAAVLIASSLSARATTVNDLRVEVRGVPGSGESTWAFYGAGFFLEDHFSFGNNLIWEDFQDFIPTPTPRTTVPLVGSIEFVYEFPSSPDFSVDVLSVTFEDLGQQQFLFSLSGGSVPQVGLPVSWSGIGTAAVDIQDLGYAGSPINLSGTGRFDLPVSLSITAVPGPFSSVLLLSSLGAFVFIRKLKNGVTVS